MVSYMTTQTQSSQIGLDELATDILSQLIRYGSGYLLPTCAFQLLSGKLYSRYPAKWVFLGALFLFELGSLISAVAPSSAVFIVGRAVAGVGAAALFTGSLVIVATIVPPEKAPAFQSVNAATFGVASAVGPVVCSPEEDPHPACIVHMLTDGN